MNIPYTPITPTPHAPCEGACCACVRCDQEVMGRYQESYDRCTPIREVVVGLCTRHPGEYFVPRRPGEIWDLVARWSDGSPKKWVRRAER